MSQVARMATALHQLNIAMSQVQEAAKQLMKEGDPRTVEKFADEYSGLTFREAHIYLLDSGTKVAYTIEQLKEVLYLQDLESIHPDRKGWREAAKAASHTILAIKELRTQFPELDVRSAKLIVEAYREGLFE
ncbi:hypothetical protein AVT69_gp193 [Pseudomonas phage PhiPA3]|uniref:Uncharacterized protein 195 n=1 Tax=Pseudomonas phage PhiPA3 TaxID=998086 RepID=F8SK63_BPPA3|nr:hypothetical protein AVT69_gp193 [Pseudomonas phage PhiPA3]AEH03618.1 hypothetical protein [Pseudomonas phage PhiPA3]